MDPSEAGRSDDLPGGPSAAGVVPPVAAALERLAGMAEVPLPARPQVYEDVLADLEAALRGQAGG